MNYYIVKMQGYKRYWLVGPFKSGDDARNKIDDYKDVDVSSCPGEFTSNRTFDFKKGFTTVIKSTDNVSCWLNNDCEFLQKNLLT